MQGRKGGRLVGPYGARAVTAPVSSGPRDAKPLRVTLLAPQPPPMGGVARWASRFLAAAPAHGLEVTLINVSPRQADMTEDSRFRWGRSIHAIEILGTLHKNLRQCRPDVVHVTANLRWATLRDGAAVELAARHGVPAVFNIRGSNQMIAWRDALPGPARHALDHVLTRASAVVVLSEELQAYLRRTVPAARIERIPNMVEEVEPAIAPLLGPRGRRLRVLFVGWQMPGKGLSELAQALLPLDDLELVTVGGRATAAHALQATDMQGHLEALRNLGRWTDLGSLAPEQVLSVYHEADIFALPTYQEGMPNVLLEAMAAGLPCVVTPVGAIPDVVGHDRALLVPPRTVAPLTDALDRLARDPQLRLGLGSRARTHVRQAHGTDTILSSYRDLYEDLARGRVHSS